MLTFGPEELKETWASWHDHETVNKQQAAWLAADAEATRQKLTRQAIELHTGKSWSKEETDAQLTEQRDPHSQILWVCWGDDAIAVRTDPVSSIKDKRYYLRWYWKTLPVPGMESKE